MNKRFSTLFVAFAALGVSAFAAPAAGNAPIGSAGLSTNPVAVTSVVDGEYYLLGESATRVLSLAKAVNGSDSLVIGTVPADQKVALWTIKKAATTALGDYYSFTNVATGKLLSLELKKNGIIVTGKTAEFGWNPASASAFTHIVGGKNYALTAASAPADSLSLTEGATAGLNIQAFLPAWTALTAAQLNEINGSSFSWTVTGPTSQTAAALASLAAVNGKFTAVGTADATLTSADQSFYLKVLGSDKGTKAKYLNVDTVYYTKTGSIIDSTTTNGGLTIGLDTLTAYVPKAGKLATSFTFSVWVNAKDSVIIEVGNVPTAAAGSTFAATSAVVPGVLSLVGFDGTNTALTASAPAIAATVYPSVSFGQGSKVELAAGSYFIYKKNQDSVYVATLAATVAAGVHKTAKVGEESALVAATQWISGTATDKPVFYNRETGNAFAAAKTLYKGSKADEYYYGADTLIIKAVDAPGKYVGYKKFGATAAEESITKVALQFNSALTGGATAFVYTNTNDSILQAANLDKDDSKVIYFNVIATDTADISNHAVDSLVRVSYKLFRSEKKDTLGFDGTNYKVGKQGVTEFVFRATKTVGQYQILPLAAAADATTLDGQVTVSGTDAYVVHNASYDALNGFFSIEAPLAPEYAKVANGHYRISSVENPTLAISINADSVGVLKAVTELKSEPFVEENFSLYIDEYKDDVVKPLYYIVTQQTLGLDSAAKANDVRFFLTAKDDNSGLKAIKAKKIGVALDSLHVYGVPAAKDTVVPADNRSTYAFLKSDDSATEYYIQNNKSGKFLAQYNGILTLKDTTDDALLFNLGDPKALPVSNDVVDAAVVKVVATDGAVVVYNAAGKKVVVSNILGQTVASTVLSSDNVSIAAPKGIVVVAVEGETAVKAIVK